MAVVLGRTLSYYHWRPAQYCKTNWDTNNFIWRRVILPPFSLLVQGENCRVQHFQNLFSQKFEHHEITKHYLVLLFCWNYIFYKWKCSLHKANFQQGSICWLMKECGSFNYYSYCNCCQKWRRTEQLICDIITTPVALHTCVLGIQKLKVTCSPLMKTS